ncbi:MULTISPECIES: hypothetical protein [Halorussus]|uniref:hypothetical protein n=1 Tax=Halorussus TaxID=1070314 RepID=UPI0020A1306A|nr:hypothetical protein [Halorussus vallis]USZ75907.1 hypothetical protein NGM07_00965 [Halorussus vallis]
MSDYENTEERHEGESTRRSVLKKGALATVASGIAGSAVSSVAAQDDGGAGDGDQFDDDLYVEAEGMKGLMWRDHWHPDDLFTVASPIIETNPDIEEVNDNIWSGYNTRIVRYLDSDEHVLMFVANEAELGPYDDNFGYVVDDDFVDNDEIVLDGSPIGDDGGVDDQELSQLRPTIFALNRENNLFGDTENLVTVQFSPIPEDQEQAVWNEYGDEFGV